ncbi:formimidoylglutamase [Microbulbifer thermotolerans]|uniref:Formimidoylglutamase n=1 Tax=Microbulbifer thermotolerans TaxID=252514 RepID=A0A143HQA6_MICTH|nr:formimidoylglutamase [Microbulbifer thermotolerans]AMX03677.1 formimidoylglutamase [Microbulbifer thermotolerans]MCX2780949.1 formimidoylglutamase [Microbulbifer thermotolerans]MCX2782066.1 formimidoylglutamase [Microbulbifer thermotolerans]MCX2796197.1 formimidoylglutamase [Microbulbifer thermotolerans]MCX2802537.1 formimidoylglutamase [Microbulbifer thermotolerans]
MLQLADMRLWRGRTDTEDGRAGERWHQRIAPLQLDSPPGVAILGFASDEGVRRNKGRIGAAKGPRVLRLAMANLPATFDAPLYDAGNVRVQKDDLESAQSLLGARIAELLSGGHFPLVLGGGHEIAFGSYLGIARWMREQHRDKTLGIINFDAHLDLRIPAPKGSSGTPFYQIAEQCEINGRPFNYLCVGAADSANTPALYQRANELGVRVIRDREITAWNLESVQERIREFIRGVDIVYLTVCLDVLPAAVMPAVSAPAGRGVSLELLEPLLDTVLASKKVCLADMAEYNPYFDIEDRAARTAAIIAFLIVNGISALPQSTI